MKGNELMESPSCIFNMDESGFPLDPKSLHIVCKRGQRHTSTLCSENKSQISSNFLCNIGKCICIRKNYKNGEFSPSHF